MPPIPIGVLKLAAQLGQRMPWLVRGRHIGALARLLQRHGLDVDAGWSANRVLAVLEQHLRATGRRVPDPAQQRNPLGYLNALLTASTPVLRDQAAAQSRPSSASARNVRLECPRVITDADRIARAAVIAQIRVDISADQARLGAQYVQRRRGLHT